MDETDDHYYARACARGVSLMTGHCGGLMSDCIYVSVVSGVMNRQYQEDIHTIGDLSVGE